MSYDPSSIIQDRYACSDDIVHVEGELARAKNLDQVRTILEDLTTWTGLESFSYIDVDPVEGLKDIHNWNKVWRERYHRKGYAPKDPVVIAAVGAASTFTWSEITTPITGEQKKIMDEASEFSINDGLVIPVSRRDQNGLRHTGYLSFHATHSSHVVEAANHWNIHTTRLAKSIMGAFKRTARLNAPPTKLTARQRECVLWASRGKTVEETALIMAISPETVKDHIRAAAQRLDTFNKAQTVAKALRLNLIRM